MSSGNGKNLQSEYEFFSLWAERVAKLIILGLLVDIAIVFLFPKPFWESFLSIFANVLIVAGVWGELGLEKRAKTAADGIVAVANTRAEEAKLEVARLSTPRVRLLTPEASAAIVAAIEPFAGTRFAIGHESVGREQWDLAWQLEPLVSKAAWIFVDWNGSRMFRKLNWSMQPHMYGVANVSNITIELVPKFRDDLMPAAKALVDALNNAGLAAKVEPNPISGTSGDNTSAADAIHLLIGTKE